jgi:hypothetical protein
MHFSGAEDRLNPVPADDADESTLGGYTAVHGRAAAFTGPDGQPYTVGIEVEAPADTDARWAGYLIFLRWAATGSAVMGHVETADLATGDSEAEVRAALEALPLRRVKQILEGEIRRRHRPHAAHPNP